MGQDCHHLHSGVSFIAAYTVSCFEPSRATCASSMMQWPSNQSTCCTIPEIHRGLMWWTATESSWASTTFSRRRGSSTAHIICRVLFAIPGLLRISLAGRSLPSTHAYITESRVFTNFQCASHGPALWSFLRMFPRYTEAVDVLPTICELFGVPVPPAVDGRSLVRNQLVQFRVCWRH